MRIVHTMSKKRFRCSSEPTLDHARAVAAFARCDVRTAYRALKGQVVRGDVGKRLATAIAQVQPVKDVLEIMTGAKRLVSK